MKIHFGKVKYGVPLSMSLEFTLFLILAGANIGLLGKELGLMNENNNEMRIIFPLPPFLFYRTTYKEVKTKDSMFRGRYSPRHHHRNTGHTRHATECTQEVLHTSSHLVPARFL